MIAEATPRPHCRRCDTQLVSDLQRKHGLCESHITEYQATQDLFQANGDGPPPSAAPHDPYATGAPLYLAAGWTGVLPLPPGKKTPPPTGYTGWNGKDPSSKMIETWCTETVGEFQAASNIAIHMPDGWVGIDVDHYGGKAGGATLAQLEDELGPLPPTYTSTSRNDAVSGIKWFRVEPGLRWPTGPGKDIEFIHKGHRYAVVWPSTHPDTGNPYIWLDHSGDRSEPPEPDACAWMPDEWQARFTGGLLREDQPEYRAATEAERAQCLTRGEPCQATSNALAKYQDRVVASARHDSMIKTVMALVRLGEQGHQGVMTALFVMHKQFTADVAPDRRDGSEQSEFQRAVNGAIAKVAATPTPEDKKGCCGEHGSVTEVHQLNLSEEFWDSRPALRRIRQAAHSRGRSADAVLYTTMARVSAMVSPLRRFENCLGEGSLNLFAAVIGKSGRGKSTAVALAKSLVQTPPQLAGDLFRDSMGIGSGEGLAELYMGWRFEDDISRPPKQDGTYHRVKVKRKLRDNAFVYVDEGQTLNQQGKRQGNIVLPTIRSAWNGETLGQSNASEETTRHLPAGTYSLGMVIGYQKDTAQELLGDIAPGTPQRFLFGTATDPTVPLEPPRHPGYLDVTLDGDGKITFCQEINDELWQHNHAKVTGAEEEDADLDSHEPLMLSKLSALLCLLDGRQMVTLDDWALAKIMYATSRAVMDDLVEYGKEKAQEKADAYADAHATREARGYLAKKNADDNVSRIALLIYKHAKDGPVQTVGAHRRMMAGRDKPLFHEALDYGVKQGWLSTDGKKIAPSLTVPEA
jgi:Bifunctional DNA primase/polymerase, N-terminal